MQEKRLAKLEAGLEGREKVLAWLHADQQQGGFLDLTTRYVGARARNRVLAYAMSLAILSSHRMITLPGKEPYSAATVSTGRLRTVLWYMTASVQKSHWWGQPRVANRTPLVWSWR